MVYVKKLVSSWSPQEHPGILVGEIVDFPGTVDRLVLEGTVALCDEFGTELSTYDTLGLVTERELEEFRAWRSAQQQQALRKSLESERETLLAEAAALKAKREEPLTTTAPVGTVADAQAELVEKKKAFGAKMAAARQAKREAKTNA